MAYGGGMSVCKHSEWVVGYVWRPRGRSAFYNNVNFVMVLTEGATILYISRGIKRLTWGFHFPRFVIESPHWWPSLRLVSVCYIFTDHIDIWWLTMYYKIPLLVVFVRSCYVRFIVSWPLSAPVVVWKSAEWSRSRKSSKPEVLKWTF